MNFADEDVDDEDDDGAVEECVPIDVEGDEEEDDDDPYSTRVV
jgi:hypothetical protein